MVLNMLYGRGENEDKQGQELTYSKVREFIDRFEAKHKTVNCRKLLDGCELSTPEGQEVFKAKNLIEKCHEYVRHAVGVLEKIIKNDSQKMK